MMRLSGIVIVMCCAALSGCGSPFRFTNLVNETTPIPGTTATIAAMGSASFDGTNVALVGLQSVLKNGIYTTNISTPNVVTKIAADGDATPGPGAAGTYNGFLNFANFPLTVAPSISNGKVAYWARVKVGANTHPAIFSDHSGTVTRIVEDSVTPPPFGMTLTAIGQSARMANGQVVFKGTINGANSAVMLYNPLTATLGKIAATTDTVPGGGTTFSDFFNAQIDAGTNAVAFHGSKLAGGDGFYIKKTTTVTTVVDTSTLIPPGTVGNFTGFFNNNFSMQGNNLYFIGTGAGGYQGIFRADLTTGVITKIVDTNTVPPEGGSYIAFLTVAGVGTVANETIFCAATNNPQTPPLVTGLSGIYTNLGGKLQKVLIPGDTLNNATVFAVDFCPDGVKGTKAVVRIFLLLSNGQVVSRFYLADLKPGSARQGLDAVNGLIERNQDWTPGQAIRF